MAPSIRHTPRPPGIDPPLALAHRPLPEGFHVGFGVASPELVAGSHEALTGAGGRVTEVEDLRPDEDYVTFRCWDPDGTEIEVFWDGAQG